MKKLLQAVGRSMKTGTIASLVTILAGCSSTSYMSAQFSQAISMNGPIEMMTSDTHQMAAHRGGCHYMVSLETSPIDERTPVLPGRSITMSVPSPGQVGSVKNWVSYEVNEGGGKRTWSSYAEAELVIEAADEDSFSFQMTDIRMSPTSSVAQGDFLLSLSGRVPIAGTQYVPFATP